MSHVCGYRSMAMIYYGLLHVGAREYGMKNHGLEWSHMERGDDEIPTLCEDDSYS